MVELPREIWLEIASHLPRRALYKMRSLNSLFLNLALDDKYGSGQVRYPGELKSVLFLQYLRTSPKQVASRLRSLSLQPETFAAKLPKASTMDRLVPDSLRKLLSMDPTVKDAIVLFDSLPTFTRLEKLEVNCFGSKSGYDSFQQAVPYLVKAFSTSYSATLTTLHLKVAMEVYRDMQLPNVTMVALRQLSLDVFIAVHSNVADAAMLQSDYMAPFINNHNATLEALSISFLRTMLRLPLPPLFGALKQFSCLSSLSLEFYAHGEPSEIIPVRAFVERHSTRLSTLQIDLRPWQTDPNALSPSEGERIWALLIDSVLAPPFPALSSFWLSTLGQVSLNRVVEYVALHGLTEFAMTDRALSFSEVERLVSHFSTQRTTLRSLRFRTRFLGPNLLTLLFDKLPELETLGLRFDTFAGRGVIDIPGLRHQYSWAAKVPIHVQEFQRSMVDERYTPWKLRHLTIKATYEECAGHKAECYKALADSLPDVVSFNNLNRSDFLGE
ncbi:hypothetical protein BKA70DRAFT_232897 [Coprinopsis sp. MPI-PUGE-AT-0042]|nr:hypothetical protein BKA70DRAFT_232897 [Coprinopsis sp. MPI-PUGE-AT-0042]